MDNLCEYFLSWQRLLLIKKSTTKRAAKGRLFPGNHERWQPQHGFQSRFARSCSDGSASLQSSPCHFCREEEGMAFESWLAEKAREELEVLEAKHPSRFHRLKLELHSFISHPDSCAAQLFDNALSFTPTTTSTAHTQVSSNRKRKIEWREEEENKARKASAEARVGDGSGEKRSSSSSVEAAVKRAEACLEMIRKVKQSLFR